MADPGPARRRAPSGFEIPGSATAYVRSICNCGNIQYTIIDVNWVLIKLSVFKLVFSSSYSTTFVDDRYFENQANSCRKYSLYMTVVFLHSIWYHQETKIFEKISVSFVFIHKKSLNIFSKKMKKKRKKKELKRFGTYWDVAKSEDTVTSGPRSPAITRKYTNTSGEKWRQKSEAGSLQRPEGRRRGSGTGRRNPGGGRNPPGQPSDPPTQDSGAAIDLSGRANQGRSLRMIARKWSTSVFHLKMKILSHCIHVSFH